MRVLLINDDGYTAQGIRSLYEAFTSAGHKVFLCAPLSQRSGASHSITLRQPLRLVDISESYPKAEAAWALDGTPADCALLACNELARGRVDIVVSGINHGANLGTDCVYSGTVGAAVEAAMLGLPALAVSLHSGTDFAPAAGLTLQTAQNLLAHPLPPGQIINLNVPAEPIRGLRQAPLGFIAWQKESMCEVDEPFSKEGRCTLWLQNNTFSLEEGSDCYWLDNGYATVSVLTWRFDVNLSWNLDFCEKQK